MHLLPSSKPGRKYAKYALNFLGALKTHAYGINVIVKFADVMHERRLALHNDYHLSSIHVPIYDSSSISLLYWYVHVPRYMSVLEI